MDLSYWEKQDLYNHNQIVIVGSGIVGLTTAIYLKERAPSVPVTIFERGSLPTGASTKNAGFACFGSVSEILDDLVQMPQDQVISLIKSRYAGLQRLLSIVPARSIEYNQSGGFEIFTKDQGTLFETCKSSLAQCNELVAEATGLPDTYSLLQESHGMNIDKPMIFNPYEGQLNPYRLIRGLTKKAIQLDVQIIHNCEILNVDTENRLLNTSEIDHVPYDQLVICTNGFARQLLPEVSLNPARNQVLITEPFVGNSLNGCYHFNKGYVYFRNYHGRILLGGGRNMDMENEAIDEFGTTPIIKEYLTRFLRETIGVDSSIKVSQWWSGIMGVGKTKETIVKEYSEGHFMGVRLGGMGVALGSEVGHKLAQMVVI
jgi:glycine/D-amino acid oxidase-like deaminating enzyme